jgi:3-oxoacyl-[acyl-carrier protein] reductase
MTPSSRRVALVTGGAGGIGRAEAVALAGAGVDVAVMAHARIAPAEETAAQCRVLGARAIVVKGDLRRSEDMQQVIAETRDTLGSLDILVNNAGVLGGDLNRPIVDLGEDAWHLMIDSHLTGTFLTIKHAAPLMVARGWGRIINTASVHGRIGGRPTLAHYAAAKAGIIALTQTAARELGPAGVTCNVVSPGYVKTDKLASYLPPERLEAIARQIPLGRLAAPEEIGGVVAFLASEAASYINGAVIDLHGGRLEYA